MSACTVCTQLRRARTADAAKHCEFKSKRIKDFAGARRRVSIRPGAKQVLPYLFKKSVQVLGAFGEARGSFGAGAPGGSENTSETQPLGSKAALASKTTLT